MERGTGKQGNGKKTSKAGRHVKRWVLWGGVTVLGLLGMMGGFIWTSIAPYAGETVDRSLLEIPRAASPSVLVAYEPSNRATRSGKMHLAEGCTLLPSATSVYTPYSDMPADLIHAFVAVEDKRFYRHKGVDLIRTTKAVWGYLTGKSAGGGSTITQQLIKNLTGDDQHTPERKLAEIFRAMDLESKADKEEILESYLNVINLAEGCFGVGMASQTYFSKEVSDLTLAECAAIAAITKNPSRYDPITHPEENRCRRRLILQLMEEQGYISEEQMNQALEEELKLCLSERPDTPLVTSWYADMVTLDVIRDLMEQYGYSYTAAAMLVYRGGLTVETVMDEALQRKAETYFEDLSHFPEGQHGKPSAAVILMDPHTGDILAVVGAVGEKKGNRLQNYATDTYRPAGSCIKPLTVYAPAVKEGRIRWNTLYEDEPLAVRGGKPWPSNADGLYRGRVNVGDAMAHSVNTVAVRIVEEMGVENALNFARENLGMKSLLLPSGEGNHDATLSSMALGQQSKGVTLRELTAAYDVFLDGIYRAPRSYSRVLDREGRIILENPLAEEENRVLTEEQAALMTKLLGTVTAYGTAARYLDLTERMGIETAGKTGTTQNNCDRRFVGYTPRLLAGVWMGYDYPAELAGIEGNPCVSIWNHLMTAWETLYEGREQICSFPVAEGLTEVEFCPLSGELPCEYCTHPITGLTLSKGWFIRGTEPKGHCTVHSEPPVRIQPFDPSEPDRIPLFPEDLLPDDRTDRWWFDKHPIHGRSSVSAPTPVHPAPSEDTRREAKDPLSRWLARFKKKRSDME